jgi:Uma2 family endonuclease
MSAPVATGLTYDDLSSFPDDHLRRELIDGELFVTPSPIRAHQWAVTKITQALANHADEHGGVVYPAPMDVVFSPSTVVEPDVVFLGPERAAALTDDRFVDVVPDLVVEVSSPSTRRLDLIKKRSLYEREGVPEYWFVDLDAQLLDVHRLDATGYYGAPATHGRGDTLSSLAAPELRLPGAAVFRDGSTLGTEEGER